LPLFTGTQTNQAHAHHHHNNTRTHAHTRGTAELTQHLAQPTHTGATLIPKQGEQGKVKHCLPCHHTGRGLPAASQSSATQAPPWPCPPPPRPSLNGYYFVILGILDATLVLRTMVWCNTMHHEPLAPCSSQPEARQARPGNHTPTWVNSHLMAMS